MPLAAPGVVGGWRRLPGGIVFPVPEYKVSPVSGVKSHNHGFGSRLAREDVGRLQE